ncbi:MAG: DNA mismatch repair endonuclease MutL [Deltaproteobacteria bacterium]|nr:DNA mismatch repair endonuclease MutL [Deltaproteobacteria bacterium]
MFASLSHAKTGKIKELSSPVIAKIAAGEVIERPASVVKELVENALDAGSTDIKIELSGGGRKLIRVTDDGEGMTPEDAHLSLKRYTTSKIQSEEDLWAIRTFGFRGEALSSIAAVSRMRLVTKREGQLAGVEIVVEGMEIQGTGEIGCPSGTVVEVHDLFFNVPARLKFLKGQGTELSHIGEVVAKMALANPKTRFQLFHEGKLLAHYPVRESLSSRLAEALGKEAGEKMHFFESRDGNIAVEGYAGEPGLQKANSRGIHLFVNRRPVRDRLLFHAALEAYRNLIPKGRYPVVVLFIQVPADRVDVNVHPSKWEVKFTDGESLHRQIVRGIRGMIEKTRCLEEWHPQVRELKEPLRSYETGIGNAVSPKDPDRFSWPMALTSDKSSAENPSFLGQIDGTYLVYQTSDGLVLIDQHAAHERILFERLLQEWSSGAIARQPLLLPELVEFSFGEFQAAAEHLSELERMGFEVERSGERSVWLRAVPEVLVNREPIAAFKEMVQILGPLGKGAPLERTLDPLLQRMACHGAIPAFQAINPEEALALLHDLETCHSPSHCPHGRPTLQKFTLRALGKMFGRRS